MSKNHMTGACVPNAAKLAQKRYLRNRETETKRTERRREATAEVVTMCVLCALNRAFGLGEARLQRVVNKAHLVTNQFDERNKAQGWAAAKTWLAAEIQDVFTGDFVLPVIVAPKKRRDWDALSTQRDVADAVVKVYVKALRETVGFGKKRTELFVRAVEQEYRDFAARAKDGDYYGYNRLAQKLGVILRTEVVVDESEATEPFFGKTLD